jgi:3-oxoacyl-[acyl-carrier-protein] synthase III
VLLEPATDGSGMLDFANEVDGTGAPYLYMPGGGSLHPPTHETVDQKMHSLRQDGSHVFKYAVRKFAESSAALLARNGFTGEDLDIFLPHQANVRIINAAQERMGIPDSKVVKNIDRYGNTTAATIPLAMGTALDEGRLKAGNLAMMAAVGAGFTVGTVLVRWTGFDWS